VYVYFTWEVKESLKIRVASRLLGRVSCALPIHAKFQPEKAFLAED
jgi:hypothetical protein